MPMIDKFKETQPAQVAEVDVTLTPTIEDATAEKSLDDLVYDAMRELSMTREDALAIVDAIFSDGVYIEEFPVTSKISARFRTRTAAEENNLQDKLISLGDVSALERLYLIQMHNLTCSLVSLGDRAWNGSISDTQYNERREWLLTLPSVLVNTLVRKLAVFDRKVMVSCQDPVLRDF